MAFLNQAVLYFLAAFLLLGGLDRIFKQFEKSAAVLAKLRLGWLAKAIDGAGQQFEEGWNAMGPLTLAMVGVIAAAPILSRCLAPLVIPVYRHLGADPSVFATTLLALDMGGYNLAQHLATAGGQINWPSFMFSGLILGSLMGPTIVFTIPVGLGMIKKSDRPSFALGVLAGLITVPLGCVAGEMVAMISSVRTTAGQPVVFTFSQLCHDLTPVVLCSLVLGAGLWRFPNAMIKAFSGFAKVIVALITLALLVVALQSLLGITLVPGLDPAFPVAGDKPGIDLRAFELVARITIALVGAYSAVSLLTRWCNKALLAAGRLLGVNAEAAAGLAATLASGLAMLKLLDRMDEKGKVLNVAFCCSAGCLLADHLAFVAASKPDMIVAVMVGKLVGGITAVATASLLVRRIKLAPLQ